jgi:hypothetical protein
MNRPDRQGSHDATRVDVDRVPLPAHVRRSTARGRIRQGVMRALVLELLGPADKVLCIGDGQGLAVVLHA